MGVWVSGWCLVEGEVHGAFQWNAGSRLVDWRPRMCVPGALPRRSICCPAPLSPGLPWPPPPAAVCRPPACGRASMPQAASSSWAGQRWPRCCMPCGRRRGRPINRACRSGSQVGWGSLGSWPVWHPWQHKEPAGCAEEARTTGVLSALCWSTPCKRAAAQPTPAPCAPISPSLTTPPAHRCPTPRSPRPRRAHLRCRRAPGLGWRAAAHPGPAQLAQAGWPEPA